MRWASFNARNVAPAFKALERMPTARHPVGPTIQTNVTYPYRPELKYRVLVQEGAPLGLM